MIARIWHGWTTPGNAAAYKRILLGEVIPAIKTRNLPGLHDIEVLRRELPDEVEFITIMYFDSLDAVRAFVGEDYERAHVPDAARQVLKRFDERSQHYEVLSARKRQDV